MRERLQLLTNSECRPKTSGRSRILHSATCPYALFKPYIAKHGTAGAAHGGDNAGREIIEDMTRTRRRVDVSSAKKRGGTTSEIETEDLGRAVKEVVVEHC